MKKFIITISILTISFACKKKKSDDPVPPPVENTDNGNVSQCNAKIINEIKDTREISKVTVTYADNGYPSTIKVDSSNTTKINLVLDEYGSVKSGTVPIPFNGIAIDVPFTSVNTYNENKSLLLKSVQTSNVPLATATITNTYTYDNASNLILLLRTTVVTGILELSNKDSIVYAVYVQNRPTKVSKYSRDVKEKAPYGTPLEETYYYDDNMNRIRITRGLLLKEETVFSNELYPAKVAYLMDLDGNPNYGNRDQDRNFIKSQKTFKACTAGLIYDVSSVDAFVKSGSCISSVALSDTVAVCGSSGSPSKRSYTIQY